MTYWDLLRELKASLSEFEAMELLAHASGKSKSELVRDYSELVSPAIAERTRALAAHRAAGEPLAYILGEWDFYGLRLIVTPDVLIPRSDSEAVVECGIDIPRRFAPPPSEEGGTDRYRQRKSPLLQKGVSPQGAVDVRIPNSELRILDLCCGSGCLGLAMLSKLPNATLTSVDISDRALAVTQKNADRLGFAERVTTIRADVLQPPDYSLFTSHYSLIITNPPYVTAAEMPLLEPSVTDWEPRLALYGGEDGLDFYRAIARYWTSLAAPDGAIVLECAYAQRAAVEALFAGVNATVVATGGEI